MAYGAYADFLPLMVSRLPDCNIILIEQAIYRASRQFCQDSEALTKSQSMDTVADQEDYSLVIPTGFNILRIYEVRVRSAAEVTAGDEGTVTDPSKYEYVLPDQLAFFDNNAPATEVITNGLTVEAIVAPVEDVIDTSMDFDFVVRWASGIRAYAYSDLMGMVKKPWTDPVESARFLRDYWVEVGNAKREKHVLGTTRVMKIQPPSCFI